MQNIIGLYRVIANENNPVRYSDIETKNGPTQVLNLTVVPFRTRDEDNIGTEWIRVALWGNAAQWYRNIPHNTLVYIDAKKEIKTWSSEDGTKSGSNSEVTIGRNDDFQPFTGTWRDDSANADEVSELKVEARSIVGSADTKPATKAPASDDSIPF